MKSTILSVGHSAELLSLRSHVLRSVGFNVVEKRDPGQALRTALDGEIDLLLLCHSLRPQEAERLIYTVQLERPEVPIVCVLYGAFGSAPQDCIATRSDPEDLIETVEKLLRPRSAGKSMA